MSNHKTYIIIPTTEKDNINYSQVNEGKETLRYSLDNSEFIVKWDGSMPSSISAITDKGEPMNHNEALVLMATPEWSSEI